MVYRWLRGEEVDDGWPCRGVLHHEQVAAVAKCQSRVGNMCGEALHILNGCLPIKASANTQRLGANVCQLIPHIVIGASLELAAGPHSRAGLTGVERLLAHEVGQQCIESRCQGRRVSRYVVARIKDRERHP